MLDHNLELKKTKLSAHLNHQSCSKREESGIAYNPMNHLGYDRVSI